MSTDSGRDAVRRERVAALLKGLLTAVKSRSFYPAGHPTVMVTLRELRAAYDAVAADRDQTTIGVVGRSIIADGAPLPPEMPFVERFAAELRAIEVEKITFLRNARAEELEALVETLALPPGRLREQGGAARVLAERAVGAVRIGHLAVTEQVTSAADGDRWRQARATWELGLQGIRELMERVRAGRAISGGETREIGALLIQGLRGQRGPMLAALALRQKSQYTFSHSLNVSLLMLAQVEMLDLTQRQLEDVAAAGLLHDLGKLYVPEEILNKTSPLTEAEWEILRRHPILGAEALGNMHDAGDLPLIVAFEHHRRHDGTGYPTCREPWPMHCASVLAAIADSYDAMRSNRPYDASWSCEQLHAQMMKLSGSVFNPVLLERFFRIIGVYPPGTLLALTSGAVARVVRNDPTSPDRPFVEILRTEAGDVPDSVVTIDLALEWELRGAEAVAVRESLPDSPEGER